MWNPFKKQPTVAEQFGEMTGGMTPSAVQAEADPSVRPIMRYEVTDCFLCKTLMWVHNIKKNVPVYAEVDSPRDRSGLPWEQFIETRCFCVNHDIPYDLVKIIGGEEHYFKKNEPAMIEIDMAAPKGKPVGKA